MRRSLMLALVVALAALVFAPAAFAQDDNPTGETLGG
jgi:putative cell wall-binding protein